MRVDIFHAGGTDIDAFREAARSALGEPRAFLVVNYDRQVLGQSGAGHISPLGAFDATTDRVLVMDVTAHDYRRQ